MCMPPPPRYTKTPKALFVQYNENMNINMVTELLPVMYDIHPVNFVFG